jgi:PBP1b-binding outer membrane lipoprotein LpoB
MRKVVLTGMTVVVVAALMLAGCKKETPAPKPGTKTTQTAPKTTQPKTTTPPPAQPTTPPPAEQPTTPAPAPAK